MCVSSLSLDKRTKSTSRLFPGANFCRNRKFRSVWTVSWKGRSGKKGRRCLRFVYAHCQEGLCVRPHGAGTHELPCWCDGASPKPSGDFRETFLVNIRLPTLTSHLHASSTCQARHHRSEGITKGGGEMGLFFLFVTHASRCLHAPPSPIPWGCAVKGPIFPEEINGLKRFVGLFFFVVVVLPSKTSPLRRLSP